MVFDRYEMHYPLSGRIYLTNVHHFPSPSSQKLLKHEVPDISKKTNQNVNFPNFQIFNFRISNLQFPNVVFQFYMFYIWKCSKFQVPTFQTVWYIDLPQISKFQILRYENNNFQGCSHIVRVFLRVFW